MKIAFVMPGDSGDVAEWSGIPLHMRNAFEDASHEVVAIDNLKPPRHLALSIAVRMRNIVSQRRYNLIRDAAVLRQLSSQVDAQLDTVRPDIIFCPGTLAVAYLKTSIPVVTWTDATFESLINYYPGYFDVLESNLRSGHAAEQSALDRGALAFYASSWAAQSAIQQYQADPKKVHVAPFGANMPQVPRSQVLQKIDQRSSDVCRLLFLGVEWERKGASIAIDVVSELNRRGIKAELDLVGVDPPSDIQLPSFVRSHGFVSKRNPRGAKKLESLFLDSNFFILPSRAECFGVVFCEASALGVPSLASDTGGISSAVRNDVNGFLVPISSPEEEVRKYVDFISSKMRDANAYRTLALSSLEEYDKRLNWKTQIEFVLARMEEVISSKKTSSDPVLL